MSSQSLLAMIIHCFFLSRGGQRFRPFPRTGGSQLVAPWTRPCLLSIIGELLKSSGWRESSGRWKEGSGEDSYVWLDLHAHLLPLRWLEWSWEGGEEAHGGILNVIHFSFSPFIITPKDWTPQSELDACLRNSFILVGRLLPPTFQLHFKS